MFSEVERNFDAAVGRQTFRNLATPGMRHDSQGHFKQVVQLVLRSWPISSVSAKAGHGDQLGRRALVPDQVGEQGRGMDHPVNALRRDAGSLHDPPFGASGLDIRRVRHAVVGRGGRRLSFGAIPRGTRSLSQSLRCSNAWRALPTIAVSTGEARLAQALRT